MNLRPPPILQLRTGQFQAVRDALKNTMLEASDEPSEITSLRRISVVPLIARFFADDSPLLSAAESFLQSELSRTPDKLGNQLACVRAVAAYFAGNPALRSSAVRVLQDMLAKESLAPSDGWWGTQLLVHTAATEFTYDTALRESAREILANTLKRASQDSHKTWFAICFSAESVAACFAEDEPLKRSARDALLGMLAKEAMKPRQNWGAVGSFARALGSCFADDLELKSLALDALKKALLGTATDHKFAKLVARGVARALASGFTPTIDIAAFLVGNGQARHLCIKEWRQCVTLHGTEQLLRQSFLACWDLPNGPTVIRVLDEIVDPDHPNRPRRALIVAPREGIRRGLPAAVLHDIIQVERQRVQPPTLRMKLDDVPTNPVIHLTNGFDVSPVAVSVNQDQLTILTKLIAAASANPRVGLRASELLGASRNDNASTRVRDALDVDRYNDPAVKELLSLIVRPGKKAKKVGYRLGASAWIPSHPDAPST
jgi:hypothetical protein